MPNSRWDRVRARTVLLISCIFLPAIRGGFIGLFLGYGIEWLTLRFCAHQLIQTDGNLIIGVLTLVVIPLLWMIFLENREKAFVDYQGKKIVNPYLAFFSMTYLMVNLPLIFHSLLTYPPKPVSCP